MTAAPAPLAAQSLLGALFGWGEAPAQPKPSVRSFPPVHHTPALSERDGARLGDAGHVGDSDDGQFQTLCVRTCDGYYWPLHYPAKRGDLKAAEALCQATCGSETRLYTRADPGVEAEEMVDAEGKSYGSSPTAFAYRKSLINGCTCRPMPWSESERARHESYALIDEEKKLRAEQAEAARVAAASEALSSAQAWAAEVAAAAQRLDQAEAHAAALLLPGPREQAPPIGPLEEELLLTLRAASDEAVSDEAAPGPEVNVQVQPDPVGVTPSGRRGRRGWAEAAVSRLGQGPRGQRVRVAPVAGRNPKPGVFAWLAGPSKFTYPGDAPGR